jgi:tetratricopeptide (TPR) repeat protein
LAALKAADGNLPEAMQLYRQAHVASGTRLKPLVTYRMACYWLGQTAEATRISQWLLQRLGGLGDTAATMFAFPHLGLALAARGRYSEAARTFEEARRFGEEYQTWPHLARALSIAAGFHQEVFDFEGNEALNQEALEMASHHPFPPTTMSAEIDLLFNYTRRGDLGRTEGLLE